MTSDADIQKQFEQTQQAKPDTEYVVLKQNPDTLDWGNVGRKTARDANAAIKAMVAALDNDDQGGAFVAIADRSWKPVKVTPQVVTHLLLEETN